MSRDYSTNQTYSNIGIAQIALKIGKKNQKDFLNKLGFFEKIDIELLEVEKPLANPNNWREHETTRIGFGHSFSITPLHLAKAYASLSNNGYTVNPNLPPKNFLFPLCKFRLLQLQNWM